MSAWAQTGVVSIQLDSGARGSRVWLLRCRGARLSRPSWEKRHGASNRRARATLHCHVWLQARACATLVCRHRIVHHVMPTSQAIRPRQQIHFFPAGALKLPFPRAPGQVPFHLISSDSQRHGSESCESRQHRKATDSAAAAISPW